jgi:transposase-like protein
MAKRTSNEQELTFLAGRRWSRDDARAALGAWRRSGLSLTQFARRQGVNVQRLCWWRKRLEATGRGSAETLSPGTSPISFIPAVVGESRPAPIVVRLARGVEVEAGEAAAVPATWLAALVVALESAR